MNTSRLVTFFILLAILGFVAILFYQVISGFLLPLFLAALLAVMFRPLHLWIVEKCKGRQALAAILTTVAILLSVLTPLGVILALAVHEGNQVLARQRGDLSAQLQRQVVRWGDRLGLQNPFANELQQVEDPLARLEALVAAASLDAVADRAVDVQLQRLSQAWTSVGESLQSVNGFLDRLVEQQITWTEYLERRNDPATSALQPPNQLLDGHWDSAELRGVDRLRSTGKIESVLARIDELKDRLVSLQRQPSPDAEVMEYDRLDDLREQVTISRLTLVTVRTDLKGGPLRAWASDMLSPGDAEYRVLQTKLRELLQKWLPTVTGQATAFLGGLVLGLVIMTISLYYFFIDGPTMIHSMMKLSPLDDEYERQLLAEFDQVSRAVVVATLLSAAVQGLLAGVGFFFAGVDSLFLLTLLTMILALVPFVGAAAVWLPVSFWLVAVDGRWLAATLLALWGAGVVSMADNLIKPIVLHGQSKLHPLLGLLSVLGGVKALGPIGILVGPMVVAILQAVLTMVNKEIDHMNLAAAKPGPEQTSGG